MMRRPPDDRNSTREGELPEFDGTRTEDLGDTYRLRVSARENADGAVGDDDRGQRRWTPAGELGATHPNVTGTFDQLRAFDNPALSLEGDPPETKPSRKTGYDPYATGVFAKPKLR